MPNAAVSGESSVQSRSADSSTHPTLSSARKSALGSVVYPSTPFRVRAARPGRRLPAFMARTLPKPSSAGRGDSEGRMGDVGELLTYGRAVPFTVTFQQGQPVSLWTKAHPS